MRLPWVSRALYELLERHAAAEHENSQMLRRENVELLAKYHEALRPSTVTEADTWPYRVPRNYYERVKTPAAPPVVKSKPSEIDKIIREQSEGDSRLARHLRAYDRQNKADGKTPDERIGLLVTWTSTEEQAL